MAGEGKNSARAASGHRQAGHDDEPVPPCGLHLLTSSRNSASAKADAAKNKPMPSTPRTAARNARA